MNKLYPLLIIVSLLGISVSKTVAQSDWPFYSSIENFKKQDSVSFPKKGSVLFIGSSSIARWDDLEESFSGYPIIQRGFGGSEFKDILHYAKDIIFPYQPKAIFLYAGENDLVKGSNVDEIYKTFIELYSHIRKELPESDVYVISTKPSERWLDYQDETVALNSRLEALSKKEGPKLQYIDIYSGMVDEKGRPNPELYVSDKLHLSPKGYAVWVEALKNQASIFSKPFGRRAAKPLNIPPFIEKEARSPQYPLKTGRTIYSDAELAVATAAIERYPEAKKVKQNLIKAADAWLDRSDEDLRDLLADARVPRSFDLSPKGCPEHGEEVFKKGAYPWILDLSQPFKVKCPIGGEVYPSNDYESYYLSDFEEKKDWDTQYVDDGWGWVSPEGERYWFVAYANHWIWHGHVNGGILNLARAYLLTGDKRYAHKAAVMLYRLAEVYPEMDYANQSRYGLMSKAENRDYRGKVVNAIWETGFIRNAAEAYDAIWDSIDDDQVLQQLYGKDGKGIRSFIEANLLEEAVDAYAERKILGNFGMHQSALLYTLLARQHMDTEKYIHLIVDEPGDSRGYTGLRYALYNSIFRDGQAFESPGYNLLWVSKFADLSELLKKGGIDLYKDPRLKRVFDGPLEVVAAGKYTVDWGDTGNTIGDALGRNPNVYQEAYNVYKDPRYLDWLASADRVGGNAYSGFNSLFRDILPENPVLADNRAVAPQKSRLLAGYGLGILNDKKDETALAFTYGMHFAHYHWDFLNFELFANGQKMMPDLGYPDAMNAYVQEVYTWSNNTVNHNTVVVDASKQNTNRPGVLHDFADGEFARTMDASSPAYSQTSQYRRNLTMVDVGNGQSYVVDFFRVAGGKQHDYILHGPPGSVSLQEGILGDKQPGTLAGPNVAVGEIYDNAKLAAEDYSGGYTGYRGSGFQYLFNVQSLDGEQPIVQYHHKRDDAARLRIHLLGLGAQDVYMADAFDKPRAKDHLIKYLISRRKGGGSDTLKSTFVSVMEPYQTNAYIESAKIVHLKEGEGIAVEIERADERDIVINDIHNSKKTMDLYAIETDANTAVVTIDKNDVLRRVFISNGTYLTYKGKKFVADPIEGIVTDFDVNTNEITVKIERGKKRGSYNNPSTAVHFSNAYQTVVHPIKDISERRKVWKIKTTDDLLTGVARLDKVEDKVAVSSTYLPFSWFYNGVTLLDDNKIPVAKVEKVEGGKIVMAEEPARKIAAGDDVWFSTVGVGDRVTIKPALSWTVD